MILMLKDGTLVEGLGRVSRKRCLESQALNQRGIFQIQIRKGNGDTTDPELE